MKIIKWLLRTLLLVCLLAALGIIGIRAFVVAKESKNIIEAEAPIDGTGKFTKENPAEAVIVLGAGVYKDGTLSKILKNRMDKVIEVYKSGIVKSIFVSGDHRLGEYDEVDHMVEYLIVQGIPEEKIWFDYNGYSTIESITQAKKEFKIDHAIIVTQQYHLYRSLYIGEKNGMECEGVAAEDAGEFWGKLKRDIREIGATVKDFFACINQ